MVNSLRLTIIMVYVDPAGGSEKSPKPAWSKEALDLKGG